MVSLANALIPAAWASGALRRPTFDPDALLDRARRKTGLTDFGDGWFLGPLRVLAGALEQEARLNALGRFGAYGQLIKVLRDRLWTRHWLAEHPEILARPLPPPVVVVGAMRSGTTRLHRLLAADERFSHLRFFETVSPVPPPDFRPGQKDPRAIEAGRILSIVRRANPRTAVIHPTGLFAPEEELGLLVASFWGMKHEAQWSVPSYARWSEGRDATPAYRHLATMLRLVGWLRGDESARPWVLKTPQHMLDLPALVKVFPDARLIFIHRDPVRVVGSSCSLAWNQMIIHSDHVDPAEVGRRWLAKTERQIDTMRRTRSGISNPAIDVDYEEMNRDWRVVMRRIYGFLSLDVAPAMAPMEHYVARAQAARHGGSHRYDLANFGLDPAAVRDRFSDYIEAFDLPKPELGASRPVVHLPSRTREDAPSLGRAGGARQSA